MRKLENITSKLVEEYAPLFEGKGMLGSLMMAKDLSNRAYGIHKWYRTPQAKYNNLARSFFDEQLKGYTK